jgi:hypothetical protein
MPNNLHSDAPRRVKPKTRKPKTMKQKLSTSLAFTVCAGDGEAVKEQFYRKRIVAMKYLHCLAIILGGFLLTRVYGAEVTPVMKEIPFEDVTPDGLLKDRAELAFRHLQEKYFQWDNISRVNFDPFPGDAIGRAINGLTLLSRALHQQAPADDRDRD